LVKTHFVTSVVVEAADVKIAPFVDDIWPDAK
jgi:hypothetical protein